MGEIRSVTLELLRSGPAHNQFLSPLTPYLALCGANQPVTVTLPFEHEQLLRRLDRLRYEIDGREVPPSQREAEVREIGEALGRVFSQVPGLLSELGGGRTAQGEMVHLRLSVGANELALVPFELAIGQDGYPGSGSPLFLQSIVPVALTREVRRSHPIPVRWNRPPRILFAFASAGDLPKVPAQEHLQALRRAIDPWIRWNANPAERVKYVARQLTVLPNASLQAIQRACAQTEYTHVHILAHGLMIERHGHYGLALCADTDGGLGDLVDGEVLATALTARDSTGATRFRPTVVSLATCDSGHAGSVITAGGSVAHAIHAGGIPWVIASQFPLWMHGSSVAAEVLYGGLLHGDDPRWVLHTLRQRLRTDSAATHDWASIVAYAVVSQNFDQDVQAFRTRQIMRRVELAFDEVEQRRLSGYQSTSEGAASLAKLEPLYAATREELAQWRQELPSGAPPRERAERLGVSAATEKRIGDTYRWGTSPERATPSYEKALEFYRSALDADPANHWVITQYLALLAVLRPEDRDVLAEEYGAWWSFARQIATWGLRTATGEDRAWALGRLAELELLGVVYAGGDFDVIKAQDVIARLCREIVDVVGRNAFAVASTRRQFDRYQTIWARPAWDALAKWATEALPVSATAETTDF